MRPYKSLFILSCISFVFTIAKGFRLPNDWAEAHWMIGYQFGFIKRGLPGAVLNLLTKGESDFEHIIIVLSLALFLILCGLFIVISYRILKSKDSSSEDFLVLFVFLTSSYVVMAAHLMGYYDHIIILILIVGISLIERKQLLAASLLLGVSVLVHETTLLISLPLCAFHVIVRAHQSTYVRLGSSLSKLLIIPALAFLGVFILNTTQSVSSSTLHSHLETYSFIGNERNELVAEAFTQSFISYLRSQIVELPYRIFNAQFIVKIGIPFTSIAFICWNKLSSPTKTKKLYFFLYVLCILIPLSLHAIAWDTARIWTYSLVVAFLGYISLKRNGVLEADYKQSGLLLIFSLCTAINLIPKLTLMDGVSERFSLLTRLISFLLVTVSVFIVDRPLRSIFFKTFNTIFKSK